VRHAARAHRLGRHRDDLALATAREQGVPVPSTELADKVLTQATELGYEQRDIAALFAVLSGKEGSRT